MSHTFPSAVPPRTLDAADFERARLTWRTPGGSVGIWRLLASVHDLGREKERTVLASIVMAGDVYGSGSLPRDPAYSFQMIAGRNRHAILRDYGAAQHDSENAHVHRFDWIEIDVPRVSLQRIDVGIPVTGRLAWPLSCAVSAIGADGRQCVLEFPISHYNYRASQTKVAFQVETGPILVPSTLLPSNAAATYCGVALAYIFINRPDRADLLVLCTNRDHKGTRRSYANFARLKVIDFAVLAPLQDRIR